MTGSQIVILSVVIAVLSSSILYYTSQDEATKQTETECVEMVTALPLVNTTTGMGMTASINECD